MKTYDHHFSEGYFSRGENFWGAIFLGALFPGAFFPRAFFLEPVNIYNEKLLVRNYFSKLSEVHLEINFVITEMKV